MSRNTNADLLRVISCIAIVGLHTLGSLGRVCCFAVPTFFLISGFFLVRRDSVSFSYLGVKLLRILKLVVLWNLVWLSLPGLFRSSPGWMPPWLSTFCTCVTSSLIQRGIWQFWYLGALMLVYLFLPVIVFLRKKYGWRYILLLWAILLVYGFFLQSISMFFKHEPVQRATLQTFRLWTWLQYFLLGGLISQYRDVLTEKLSTRENLLLLAAFVVVSTIVQYYVGTYGIFDTHAEYFYDDITVFLYVVLLCLLILRLDVQKYRRPIHSLAELTLGVYIIHPFIIRLLERVWFVRTLAGNCAFFLTVTVLSFALVFVLHKLPVLRQLVTL